MKILIALLLMVAPASAQCFHAVEMPSAMLTEIPDGLVWSDHKTTVHLDTTTGESGVVPRMAFNPENNDIYQFAYADGNLVFNDDVYVPGCKINGAN